MTRCASIDDIVDLFDRFGDEFYGEKVSQRDHALQCAALAVREGSSSELVAAALLHDVGHLLELADDTSYVESIEQDRHHQIEGARWLSSLFSPAVTDPIEHHVTAKRWRCTVEDGYAERLSEASQISLALQGGMLSQRERHVFEASTSFGASLTLRSFDDTGKVSGLSIPPFSSYRTLLESLAVPH